MRGLLQHSLLQKGARSMAEFLQMFACILRPIV